MVYDKKFLYFDFLVDISWNYLCTSYLHFANYYFRIPLSSNFLDLSSSLNNFWRILFIVGVTFIFYRFELIWSPQIFKDWLSSLLKGELRSGLACREKLWVIFTDVILLFFALFIMQVLLIIARFLANCSSYSYPIVSVYF